MNITFEQYEKILDDVAEQLLTPNQEGGAWFNGSKEEFEEWAGDVFDDVVEHTLKAVGIVVNYPDYNE